MQHTTGTFFLAVTPASQGGVKWPWGRWATEAILNPLKHLTPAESYHCVQDKGKGTKLLLGFPDRMSARLCYPIAAGEPESPAKPHLACLSLRGEGSSVSGQGIKHCLVGISPFSICTVYEVGTWKTLALTSLQREEQKHEGDPSKPLGRAGQSLHPWPPVSEILGFAGSAVSLWCLGVGAMLRPVQRTMLAPDGHKRCSDVS